MPSINPLLNPCFLKDAGVVMLTVADKFHLRSTYLFTKPSNVIKNRFFWCTDQKDDNESMLLRSLLRQL